MSTNLSPPSCSTCNQPLKNSLSGAFCANEKCANFNKKPKRKLSENDSTGLTDNNNASGASASQKQKLDKDEGKKPEPTSSGYVQPVRITEGKESILVMWEDVSTTDWDSVPTTSTTLESSDTQDKSEQNEQPVTFIRRQTYVRFIRRGVKSVTRGNTPKALSALGEEERRKIPPATDAKEKIDRDEEIDLAQPPTIKLSDRELYEGEESDDTETAQTTDEVSEQEQQTGQQTNDEQAQTEGTRDDDLVMPVEDDQPQTEVVETPVVNSNVNAVQAEHKSEAQTDAEIETPPQAVEESEEDKLKEAELAAANEQVEDWEGQDDLREFDKGHIVALMLGGVDDSWQIVPQARSCNRGTWLNMEGQIWRMVARTPSATEDDVGVGAQDDLVLTLSTTGQEQVEASDQQLGQQDEVEQSTTTTTTTIETQPISGNLFVPNTLNARSISVEVFIYYHELGDPRIPVWFYVQVYQGVKAGKRTGLAHYSFANARIHNPLMPTEEEVAEFVRAHKALEYPYDETMAQKVADGQWYPDPPYRALDWLYRNNSPVVPNQSFSAAAFPTAQIALIRKYNRWLNGGPLMSDYRPEVRHYVLQRLTAGAQIYDKIMQEGTKLDPEELKLVDDLIGIAEDEIDTYLDKEKSLAEYAGSTAAEVEAVRQTVNQKVTSLNNELKRATAFEQIKITERRAPLIDQNKKLAELRNLKAAPEVYRRVKEAGAGVKLLDYERDAMMSAKTVHNWRGDDYATEHPDLYPELDESGGRNYPEVDHVKPKNRGGKNTYLNARLISFAHNHIYRDKKLDPEIGPYSDSKALKKYEAAKKKTEENYKTESLMSKIYIAVRERHAQGVWAFMQDPHPHLLLKIEHFIAAYDKRLRAISDRPPPFEEPQQGNPQVDQEDQPMRDENPTAQAQHGETQQVTQMAESNQATIPIGELPGTPQVEMEDRK